MHRSTGAPWSTAGLSCTSGEEHGGGEAQCEESARDEKSKSLWSFRALVEPADVQKDGAQLRQMNVRAKLASLLAAKDDEIADDPKPVVHAVSDEHRKCYGSVQVRNDDQNRVVCEVREHERKASLLERRIRCPKATREVAVAEVDHRGGEKSCRVHHRRGDVAPNEPLL
eukprot:CAMPEP_0206125708 /NCGR_PEP_ID=MMETSP1472-20131121/18501_1 /ASSEMBLY_ACC=CAM_ASM_001108 /TAXON_ID=41880 /ORGANISM="Pycnococcus provasolii, Strain RCC251" /LENGTH=169 /DNA_ID=CAMNT_0053516655 /DNA_START=223 /DNA_END=733 /DNA_ORIENTATION=+